MFREDTAVPSRNTSVPPLSCVSLIQPKLDGALATCSLSLFKVLNIRKQEDNKTKH